MDKAIEIRPLARDDNRSGFSCGQDDLDRFFEHYAGQNQFKLHLAVTYVAVVDERIVGFAAVAASSIERARAGFQFESRFPDLARDHVPSFREIWTAVLDEPNQEFFDEGFRHSELGDLKRRLGPKELVDLSGSRGRTGDSAIGHHPFQLVDELVERARDAAVARGAEMGFAVEPTHAIGDVGRHLALVQQRAEPLRECARQVRELWLLHPEKEYRKESAIVHDDHAFAPLPVKEVGVPRVE